MDNYYSCQTLLSKTDINGRVPEMFLCTTNRTGGKTTSFSRMIVNKFLKGEGKFGLQYRTINELADVGEKFFKDIKELFFQNHELTVKDHDFFVELYLDGDSCGYAWALNSAGKIKKYSHYFSDVNRYLFDEFQEEDNKYLPNEIGKFLSIHTSIARGRGKQSRYVPVYMLANPVTLLNPYYVALGISSRIQTDTNFLRGDGFVLENGFVESAANAMAESGVMRAFANEKYTQYAKEKIYLNDNYTFIENPPNEHGYYQMTLKYEGREYGVVEYRKSGIVYITDRPDTSYPIKIAVTTDDHNINYVMLKRSSLQLANLRYFYTNGCCRFKNLQAKQALMSALSY